MSDFAYDLAIRYTYNNETTETNRITFSSTVATVEQTVSNLY